MIVVPDTPEKRPAALPEVSKLPSEDPPPTYTAQSIASRASGVAQTSSTSPTDVKPSNYLSLCRQNHPIKGTYVIDPSLHIPSSLLPPLATGETEKDRKNLKLESVNGSVDAHIRIVGTEATEVAKDRPRVTFSVRSLNGAVVAKVHAPATARPCFYLSTTAQNGSTLIHIPRSFEGPVTITSHNGSVKISDELEKHITTFSEVDKTRRCFVGDFSGWSEGEGGWNGDELTVFAQNGRVKVYYDDEEELELSKPKGKGFLSRVFNL